MSYLLVTGVQNQPTRAGDILIEENFPIATVQGGNLNVLQDRVCPIKVPTHPVHSYSLWYHQTSAENLG